MSWLSKIVHKIVNLVTGKKDSPAAAIANAPPPAAPAAGKGGLPGGVLKALQDAFADRTQSEIDANRSQTATPVPSKVFSDTLAEEYEKWFKTLHAGIMSPAPTALPALKTGLKIFEFTGWGTAFAAYWTSTTWTPSGIYTGGIVTNAPAMGAALQSEINTFITSGGSKTMEAFADRIATVLYTYTTGLTVQATLSVPPNTKVETVK